MKHAEGLCCLCAQPLSLLAGRLVCPRGHSFDLAREGYANLLPAQKKHALQPGDSREMVTARRKFLAAGHYAPFARALGELGAELARDKKRASSGGCGLRRGILRPGDSFGPAGGGPTDRL